MKIIILIMKIFTIAFVIAESTFSINAQCDTCSLPRHPQTKVLPLDGVIDVWLKDNQPPIYGISSVKRVTMKKYGKFIQGIKATRIIEGNCLDTILLLEDVEKLYSSNLGIGGTTLNVPVLPGREYYYDENISMLRLNTLSIYTDLNFIGNDKSSRKIGSDGFSYGLNFLLYPFKDTFGKRVKVGFGSGLLVENGRTRIPAFGSIRYNFLGTEYEEEYFNFFPSACKFGVDGEPPISPQKSSLIEIPTNQKVDSTVYFYLDKKIVRDDFRPYIFLNGGFLFDTDFDGSGNEPSINKQDYGQYFFQIGVGIPLYDILDVSTGISYYRFNLRTPCEACQNNFVVNTNQVIGTFLNIGIYLTY